MIALAVEADDEHRTAVTFAPGLVRSKDGRVTALGRYVADALAKTTAAQLVGATKKFDRIIGIVWSQGRLHGAEMLVAQRKYVHPHAKRV